MQSMPSPDISVVIPAWNAASWIRGAIDSVLSQTGPSLEVIVIDDGSTDESFDIANSYGAPVRAIRTSNAGAAHARNRGLHESSGDYIMFLDSDDYVDAGSLAAWVGAARASDSDVVFGPFCIERDGQRLPGIGAHVDEGKTILEGWITGRGTPPCAVVWEREFIGAIGGWKPLLRNDDGELGIRALLKGARATLAYDGMGVWVHHPSPNRISLRKGPLILKSEYDAFRELETLAEENGKSLRREFSLAYYRMAYEGHVFGAFDLADEALHHARRLGLKGHPGPLKHRLLSTFLGLPLRMRVAKRRRRRAGMEW